MVEIREELLDELIKDYKDPEDLLGKNGLIGQLKKRLIEKAMEAEMKDHLGYPKNRKNAESNSNSRNGHSQKKVVSDRENLEITVPRDRESRFEPRIIPKHQRRFDGFDQQIIALYARGMSTRDIQSSLEEMYEVDVSPSLISTVTEGIINDFKEWQSRPLNSIYPIVFFDCLVVKSREEGKVSNRSVYLALGVNMEGTKELLGLWITASEGAKFWLSVITELKNRGVNDLFIACVDGLKGFPEAIESVFPGAEIQLCIVHMIRNSCRYVSWKDRKAICADLKTIYTADTVDQAELALDEFAEKWDHKYPTISLLWRRHWDRIIPFLAYPEYIRKVIYTTNAIESLNRSLKKVLKTKGVFPNDQAIQKLLFLALRNISKKWTMPIREWKAALNQFAIRFQDRFPLS